jgi:hypothetical protein
MKYLLVNLDLVYPGPHELADSDFKIFDNKEEAVNSIDWLDKIQKKQLLSKGVVGDAEWVIHLLELPNGISHVKYTQEEKKILRFLIAKKRL